MKMREKLLNNRAYCTDCHTLLESTSVHDFRTCKCGSLSVDGGLAYIRRCYDPDKNYVWVELSEADYVPDLPL